MSCSRALRTCESLGCSCAGPGPGARRANFGLVASASADALLGARAKALLLLPAQRPLYSLRANGLKLRYSGRSTRGGGSVGEHLRPSATTASTLVSRGFGLSHQNLLSFTTGYRQMHNETKYKDQSRQVSEPSGPLPEKPRGIRKVIPKVLPSLTPHENIYTVPNILTFSRLITAPFVGYAILHDAHGWALGLFAYAGASDLLDGWIARRWKLQTVVGSVVDPMADKTLMTVLTVCLAMRGALPVWLAIIILGRDVALGLAAIYYRWVSLPPPKTFTRYWDFSLPSAEVRPTTISKYNTFLQLGLMGVTMVTPLLSVDVGPTLTAFQYLVATTTVWSGLSYIFSKDAVKILSHNKGKKKRE
ncbi:CDP-alcohol phosphatidyltransferase-domain-containing protein [Durotheca rogersii]|uniref:CDP-alcohol phosphatidyltransferase-domain-containing protein n=1 Tax=Durotheca rogersii TaxID=419775 RepID=UPI0022209C7E|nr:CDP-alcohol phosphatidyltransferase-domain-containing protein [Durotheca rogersii]KAI5855591.1 CDP-alcohol phosphatidyltransferase-domain-containing protein [Durotheca rogersii]